MFHKIVLLLNRFLPEDSLRRRVTAGTFWSVLGSLFSQIAVLLSSVLCARILGEVVFGQLSIVRSSALMLSVVAGTGLGVAATKHVAAMRSVSSQQTGAAISLMMRVALCVGVFVTLFALASAQLFTEGVLSASELLIPFILGALGIPFAVVSSVQLGVFCGLEAFREHSVLVVVDGILLLLFMPIGAIVDSINGALAGFLLARCCGTLVKHYSLHDIRGKRGMHTVTTGGVAFMDIMIKSVAPVALIGVCIQPFEWLVRTMLAKQPGGFAELGVFAAIYPWSQMIVFVPMQIAAVTMPVFANLLASGKIKEIKKLIVVSQTVMYLASSFTAGLLCMAADHILSAYGRSFVVGRTAFIVISVASVVLVGSCSTRAFFIATGRAWEQVLHSLLWGVVLTLTAFYYAPKTALALALCYLIANVFVSMTQLAAQLIQIRRLSAEKQERVI